MPQQLMSVPALTSTASDASLKLPTLLLIAGCNLVVGSGAMVVTGLLAPLAADFAVSTAVAGQLITAYALAFAISAPIVAVLAARVCRKRLLVWALLAFGSAMIVAALAPNFLVIWLARALGGVSAAAFVPNASAVVGALATPATRGRALAIVFGGFTLALVFGAPLGTWLGMLLGWREAIGSLGVVAAASALILKRQLPGGILLAGATLSNLQDVGTRPRLIALIVTNSLAAFGSLSFFAFAAIVFPALLSSPASIVGTAFLVFGVGNLLGNVLSLWALDRIGAATIATAGFIGSALAMALLASGPVPSVVWATLLVWGLTSFVSSTAQQARLVAAAPWLASALLPLNSSAIFLGQAMGAVAGGWLLTRDSSPATSLAVMASVALGLAAFASLFLARREGGAAQ